MQLEIRNGMREVFGKFGGRVMEVDAVIDLWKHLHKLQVAYGISGEGRALFLFAGAVALFQSDMVQKEKAIDAILCGGIEIAVESGDEGKHIRSEDERGSDRGAKVGRLGIGKDR